MDNFSNEDEIENLAEELEEQLSSIYGAVVLSGEKLQKALGYNSIDSLRQAILRKSLQLPIFTMDKRRGKYALVKDIALYLAKERYAALNNNESGGQ